jgi:hypothetical protein
VRRIRGILPSRGSLEALILSVVHLPRVLEVCLIQRQIGSMCGTASLSEKVSAKHSNPLVPIKVPEFQAFWLAVEAEPILYLLK